MVIVMKLILWGCGKNANRLDEYIKRYCKDIEIVAWCDKNKSANNHDNNKDMVSIEKAMEMCLSGMVDGILPTVNSRILNEIVYELKQVGIKDFYYIFENDLNNKNGIIRKITTEKPSLEYFEFHVCDHCNLMCQGCLHLSNVCEENFADITKFSEDIERMKKIFSAIHTIKLLGGEPLLNKNLGDFITRTREVFPEAEIRIATNGLLIEERISDLYKIMNSCNAKFFISAYPPTRNKKKNIIEVCNKYNVSYFFTENIDKFRKQTDPSGGNDIKESFEECRSQMGYCFGLRDGKLSPCVSFYIKMLNERFNINIPITDHDEFDIYKYYSGWDLIEKLYKPIPLCEYCGKSIEFDWKCGCKDVRVNDYTITTV